LCHKWFPHLMADSETQATPEIALAVHG
jgi:hypothetical protein